LLPWKLLIAPFETPPLEPLCAPLELEPVAPLAFAPLELEQDAPLEVSILEPLFAPLELEQVVPLGAPLEAPSFELTKAALEKVLFAP
jgi:hypothetical protein